MVTVDQDFERLSEATKTFLEEVQKLLSAMDKYLAELPALLREV